MTRDEIVNAVNRLSVGYNVTWWEIASDADMAIHKINSFLCAEYPLMSEILTSPDSIYAIKKSTDSGHFTYISIFPDIYIRTIVIPYIASEILARDEEFTTIYNKYAMDVENGLFTMFQNEYNRVPVLFRQKDTTGVFFSDDYEREHPKPDHTPKLLQNEFHIRYHLNQDGLIYTGATLPDIKYSWKDNYELATIEPTDEYVSIDGIHYYTFNGWYKDAAGIESADLSGTIVSDIDVYAKWNEHDMWALSTITVSDKKYTVPVLAKLLLTPEGCLKVPTNINGFIIDALIYNTAFDNVNVSLITKLEIPYYGIRYISPYFFTNFPNLEEIRFYGNASESQVHQSNTITSRTNMVYVAGANTVDKYLMSNIQLSWGTGSLAMRGNKVTSIIIPNSVSTINKEYCFKSHGTNSTVTSHNDKPDAIGTNIKTVEVICDWAYESKPSTFIMPGNDTYIKDVYTEIINNTYATYTTIYHITYKKLSE